MPHPISALGVIHTVISLAPVVAGIYSYARYHRIEAGTRSGKVYLAGLALSVATAFGLSSTGGLNPGHALGILALLAAFGGMFIVRLSFLGRMRPYLSTFGLSFSFFLLGVPGISETLRRLPVAHPLAESPQSPVLLIALLVWLAIFIAGFSAQSWRIRSYHRISLANAHP